MGVIYKAIQQCCLDRLIVSKQGNHVLKFSPPNGRDEDVEVQFMLGENDGNCQMG
jgi:hypothetical protein